MWWHGGLKKGGKRDGVKTHSQSKKKPKTPTIPQNPFPPFSFFPFFFFPPLSTLSFFSTLFTALRPCRLYYNISVIFMLLICAHPQSTIPQIITTSTSFLRHSFLSILSFVLFFIKYDSPCKNIFDHYYALYTTQHSFFTIVIGHITLYAT